MQCARLIAETLVFGASCLGKSLSLKKCNCNICQMRSKCGAESFSVGWRKGFPGPEQRVMVHLTPTFKPLLSPWSHTLLPALFTFSRHLLVVRQGVPPKPLFGRPFDGTQISPF